MLPLLRPLYNNSSTMNFKPRLPSIILDSHRVINAAPTGYDSFEDFGFQNTLLNLFQSVSSAISSMHSNDYKRAPAYLSRLFSKNSSTSPLSGTHQQLNHLSIAPNTHYPHVWSSSPHYQEKANYEIGT